jgi:DNA-binding beta-propeller fold protein YncE
VKRIPTGGLDEQGRPLNVKGVCASARTGLMHISTIRTLMCLDLTTETLLWEKPYDGGCDRMALSPDGEIIYLPSLEKDHWHVVRARTGEILTKIVPKSGAHNTVYGPDGREVYLAGLKSPMLSIADTRTHTVPRACGPFSASIRPFTVNGSQTLCFVNVNELLGFEIGDLKSGRMLHRVEVQGFEKGLVKRHGCPSHGIGLTPDEKEVWVCDAANSRMHIFEAAPMPPKQIASVEVRDQPGWISFSFDGKHAWPSTGDVIDTATRKVVARLTDEEGRAVGSEKMVEIHWREGKLTRAGDQFGVGQQR